MKTSTYVVLTVVLLSAVAFWFFGCWTPLSEASGLAASRLQHGIFWTHNDSGGGSEVFGIDRARNIICRVAVVSAKNRDWEAISADRDGHLYIADFGNNDNRRQDLAIYRVPEPRNCSTGADATKSVKAHALLFRYEDQVRFPDRKRLNFDAEALFVFQPKQSKIPELYILTKHRSDTETTMYRLKAIFGTEVQVAERVDRFDVGGHEHWFGGKVTGVAIHPEQTRFAVLTYHAVYIFKLVNERPNFEYLTGRVSLSTTVTQQVEGISWAGDSLMIINEQGDSFILAEHLLDQMNGLYPEED